MRHFRQLALFTCVASLGLTPQPSRAQFYRQTNLVTDNPALVPALFTDPNLVNPWGIAYSTTSPFWVADNNAGVATVYQGNGAPQPLVATLYRGNGTPQPLVVTIPGAGGQAGTPTGIVFNSTASSGGFNGDAFIFVNEDGTISGWRGGTNAITEVPAAADNANVYKGLAIGSTGAGTFIYATNFRKGQVDVYDTGFNLVKSFTDPAVDPGFAPFGIQSIVGKLYVTFALQQPDKHDDQEGPGNGFVDIFDTNGNLLQRLLTHGPLNSPWGLALAPAAFGPFGGDLLVGNFGDSRINAFDPLTGAFRGTLSDLNGQPLVLTVSPPEDPQDQRGLWSIIFGNGGAAGDPNTLFFASGINDESDGLFGNVQAVPEPGTLMLLGFGTVSLLGYARRQRKQAAKDSTETKR